MSKDLGYITPRRRNEFSLRRRKKKRWPFIVAIIICSLVIVAAVYFIGFGKTLPFISQSVPETQPESVISESSTAVTGDLQTSDDPLVISVNPDDALTDGALSEDSGGILKEADLYAASYDYDKAIELVTQASGTQIDSETASKAIASYQEQKDSCVAYDDSKITHVFFHSLIIDTARAFDSDQRSAGYNQVMTTAGEFTKILESMYERGFVLVSLHDIAYEVDDTENGGKKMLRGDIMLPPGKKAFVLSQDDVCYYEYMTGDGFAKNLCIGDDQKPTCEYILDDGTTVKGSYDVVPMLDDFIEEHPDFSYRGAKGCVAVTGYNGVFGYRTANSYEESNPNIEEDRETVKKVAQCLRDDGWEIASHSWGHRNLGTISIDEFHKDCDKWQQEVAPLIGGTDILIFPFGSDVADWHPYKADNERYAYLFNQGFRYFCNVDSTQYFVQFGNDFLRQGRRNLDGYRMYRDIAEPDQQKLSDLMDVNEVFDSARPVPVPSMTGAEY